MTTTTSGNASIAEFKVGDKVLIAERDEGWAPWATGMNETVGDMVTITGIRGPGLTDDMHIDVNNGYAYRSRSLRHADYKPEVGDVVEFDGSNQGIVFQHDTGPYVVAVKDGPNFDIPSERVLKKIGHTAVMDGIRMWSDARPIAKAYFSEQSEPKSYADRQAAWVKEHGIVKGSEVKVVRKFEAGEDGSTCCDWDSTQTKAEKQGKTCYIRSIYSKEIVLCGIKGDQQGCGIFPYTALEPVK